MNKMNISTDKRVVATLDAGGTNLVFSAIQGDREVTESIHLASVPNNLSQCLNTITDGFR